MVYNYLFTVLQKTKQNAMNGMLNNVSWWKILTWIDFKANSHWKYKFKGHFKKRPNIKTFLQDLICQNETPIRRKNPERWRSIRRDQELPKSQKHGEDVGPHQRQHQVSISSTYLRARFSYESTFFVQKHVFRTKARFCCQNYIRNRFAPKFCTKNRER